MFWDKKGGGRTQKQVPKKEDKKNTNCWVMKAVATIFRGRVADRPMLKKTNKTKQYACQPVCLFDRLTRSFIRSFLVLPFVGAFALDPWFGLVYDKVKNLASPRKRRIAWEFYMYSSSVCTVVGLGWGLEIYCVNQC